jgi:glycine/D-amino acid oxidase-like deaminating enzyme
MNHFTHNVDYRFSIWEKECFVPKTDVIIIGAGIVGLNAAISLKQLAPSLKVSVLERGFIPSGASTRNAGFACFGSVSELLADMEYQPKQLVGDIVKMRWEGLGFLRSRILDTNMDYQTSGGVEVFRDIDQFQRCSQAIEDINTWIESLTGIKNAYHLDSDLVQECGFQKMYGAIVNSAEGVLHPGKMMKSLIAMATDLDVQLFFGVQVQRIEEKANGVICILGSESLESRYLLLANNGFATQLIPELELKPARNMVLLSTELKKKLPGNQGFHLDQGYVYWRMVGDRLLIGGGRNIEPESETTTQFGYSERIKNYLETIAKEHVLPDQDFQIQDTWSGIMGIGTEKMPIIKMHSDRIGLAVRMGGMGVAIGSQVGHSAAEMLLEKLG